MDNGMQLFMNLGEGLLNNILLTVLSCIVPLLFGCLMTVLFALTKKLRFIRNIFQGTSLISESLCPAITIIVVFYLPGMVLANGLDRWLAVILGFTISFLGYMVKRYDQRDSILKNLLVNSLGLTSTVFKWSFVVGYVGVLDMLRAGTKYMAVTVSLWGVLITLAISFVILLVIEGIRYLLKELLK